MRVGKVDRNRWRRRGWGLALVLLLAPLLAMQVSDSVRWDAADFAMFAAMLADFDGNLKANGIDVASEMAVLGPWLTVNPETERFEGEFAEEANGLLDERYRKGHELPVI